jgi:hypothetical protein
MSETREARETDETRGGFIGFWTTLPGLLTAVAAVVTAAGGFYIASRTEHTSTPPPKPPDAREVVINLSTSGGNAPSVPADVGSSELQLNRIDVAATSPVAALRELTDRCSSGDDNACSEIVDDLVNECDSGDGASCDMLYQITEPGSDFEAFGATCGQRLDMSYAGRCSEI